MTPALSVRFDGGRYHATPWNRSVNEADVEWPPSAWRVLRALIATWYGKVDRRLFPDQTLNRLIASLAAVNPSYHLPPAVATHTRHYMPWNEGATENRALIFDGFIRLAPETPVIVAWPGVDLNEDCAKLLKALVPLIGYLGRAESWASVTFIEDYGGPLNCLPVEDVGNAVERNGGRDQGSIVHVPVSVTADAYAAIREHWLANLFTAGKLTKKQEAKREAVRKTLPDNFFEAVAVETGDSRNAGWRIPPACRMATYRLPPHALEASLAKPALHHRAPRVTTVRLSLYGKPLPRIETSLEIGEIARGAAMARARDLFGPHGIPDVLSGHGPGEADPSHPYASYIPEDANVDGYIDHLLIHAPAGIDDDCLKAIGRIDRLFHYGHGRLVG
jgi:CRISPR-associated protein Csb2